MPLLDAALAFALTLLLVAFMVNIALRTVGLSARVKRKAETGATVAGRDESVRPVRHRRAL